MKRKALIIAALPAPFEGPWVELGDTVWTYTPDMDLAGCVEIEVKSNGRVTQLALGSEEIQFTGEFARGVIKGDPDVPHITVNIHA